MTDETDRIMAKRKRIKDAIKSILVPMGNILVSAILFVLLLALPAIISYCISIFAKGS